MEISVVIPTYNRGPLLPETVASVLRQTRPVSEILIVDDGSTDDTRQVVAALAGPIRYIHQQNAGPAAARNQGLRLAQGEWIAFLDSDDEWLPEKIAVQTEFLQAHPEVDFLFAQMIVSRGGVDAAGPEVLDEGVLQACRAQPTDLRDLFESLLVTNPIPTSSVLLRREKLAAVGFMREDIRCSEDLDWWLRWALAARCGFLEKIVERRKLHGGNIIQDRLLMLTSTLRVLEEFGPSATSLSPSRAAKLARAVHHHRYELASEWFQRRQLSSALSVLRTIDPRGLGSFGDAAKWLVKLCYASLRLTFQPRPAALP